MSETREQDSKPEMLWKKKIGSITVVKRRERMYKHGGIVIDATTVLEAHYMYPEEEEALSRGEAEKHYQRHVLTMLKDAVESLQREMNS